MAEKTFRPMLTYSDEFHHAVTDQYRRIVEYFKPEFLLGLTATPERMDGRSIYEICDYNVPYEISLKEAINKGMLVPFHYYGIYDDTDYSSLHVVRGRYDEKELNESYIGNVHRHEMIYKYYCKYASKRALGFCCSREHAEEMARDFSLRDEYFRVKELLGHRPTRLELFTYMDADIYQMIISRSNLNPFRRYLEFLHELNELTPEETAVFQSIGREFIRLIETTNMSRVYKMPVLTAFYHDGQMRMAVTEDLLISWKAFFGNGTNWKDLDRSLTYDEYRAIPDRDHIRKIMQMPVHFLQESGKGFFVKKEGCALALRDELAAVIRDPVFVGHVKDVIDYRTMDYYQRRYVETVVERDP